MTFPILLLYIHSTHAYEVDLTEATVHTLKAYPSIRYFNNSAVIGHSVPKKTIHAILIDAYTQERFDEITGKNYLSNLNRKEYFAVLLNSTLFTTTNLKILEDLGTVASVVVVDDPNYSQQSDYLPPTQNCDSKSMRVGDVHYSSEYEWNPDGNLLLESKFSIHIAYTSHNSYLHFLKAVKHNQNNAFSSNRPLIRMSVSDTVVGSGNAFRCFNENECEPLNDRVLYGTIGPINNTTRYVFLTAPMDTRTPFSGFARGASAEVSSTAALLGAIQTISEFIHAKANASGLDPNTEITNPSFFSRTLAFGFFPGTNFGNFGAKKFLCNIYLRNKPTANHQSNEPTFNNQSTTRASLRKHRSSSSEKINKRVKAKWLMDRFSEEKAGIENNDPLTQISRASDYANLTVDRIDSLISIGHLSIPTPPSKTTKLFIHAEHTADSTALQATMKNAADAAKTKLAMTIDTETVSTLLTPGIPPSPAGAFVQEREDIPTVHLATHGPTFDMPYYHSHLDRFYNLDAICDASTLAARTALVQLGIPSAEVDVSNISANCTEIGLFMDCQIDNPNCSLIKERFQINTLPADDFLTHDTSTIPQLVYTSHVSLSSALTGRLLQNYTGRIGGSCTKTSDCKTGESCEFGKCVYTPLAFHTVYSPRIAFSSSIDDWVLTNQCSRDSSKNDDDEPLWMVSGLSGVEFMLGITAPAFLETTILVVGIVVFILLIGLVIVLRCFFNKKMKKA